MGIKAAEIAAGRVNLLQIHASTQQRVETASETEAALSEVGDLTGDASSVPLVHFNTS